MWGEHGDQPFERAVAAGQVPASEQRAVSLLSKIVPDDSFRQFIHTGHLHALGQLSGNHYVIVHGDRTLQLDGLGEPLYSYCMHSPHNEHIPATDDVLALWLIIHGHEDRFLNLANRSDASGRDDLLDENDNPIEPEALPPVRILRPDVLLRELQAQYQSEQERFDIEFQDEENVEVFPDIKPNETLEWSLDDLANTGNSYRNLRRERERRLEYRFHASNFLNYNMERLGLSPLPIRNAEGQYITRGIGTAILTVEPLSLGPRRPMVVYYNTPRGLVPCSIRHWESFWHFDNSCLFQLLSARAKCQPDQYYEPIGRVQRINPDAPTNRLTKCIMGYETSLGLGVDELQRWEGKKVLIDDRVGRMVISLPDARHLGTIVSCPDFYAGIVICEPQNIVVQYYYDGNLYPMSTESIVETLHSGFPDGNDAINYDIEQYQHLVGIGRLNPAAVAEATIDWDPDKEDIEDWMETVTIQDNLAEI